MSKRSPKREPPKKVAHPYAGRWIARLGEQIVGQGGTPEQAVRAAKAARPKEDPEITFMPHPTPLNIPPIVGRLQALIPDKAEIYLVGGGVRDMLLGQSSKDFDFVTPAPAIPLARKVAEQLDGAFYILDKERDAGRVLLVDDDSGRIHLDFTAQRGSSLDADLRGRDFTINAMALDLRQPQALLDPLGGAADLQARVLRACSSHSFEDDPIRVLRAVRMAASFRLKIEQQSREAMRTAAPQLGSVSAERQRDEVFRLLLAPKAATSLRALELLGALKEVLPEVSALKGRGDLWESSLRTLEHLDKVLSLVGKEYPEEGAKDMYSGLIVLSLGRYRQQIGAHLDSELVAERPLRGLLCLAGLYHAAGEEAGDSAREREKATRSAALLVKRAEKLRLSSAEIERLGQIVRHQNLVFQLSKADASLTRRAIYRFFRTTGEAGVDVCLLSLAVLMSLQGQELSKNVLEQRLALLRALLESYWEHYDEIISPPTLVNGEELMAQLGLRAGQRIGMLLEALREAQAAGEVKTAKEAFALAKDLAKE